VLLIGQIMTGWYKENRTKSQRRRYVKVSSLVVDKYGITRAYCQLTNKMVKDSLLWFPETFRLRYIYQEFSLGQWPSWFSSD